MMIRAIRLLPPLSFGRLGSASEPLDAFRVEATVSDVHATRLLPGLPVRVTLEGASLPGSLSSVYPKIENGAVRFAVELSDPSDRRLRQSLRVDVVVCSVSNYCVAKVNSLGCTPSCSATGSPSVTGPDDFVVQASNVRSNSRGLLAFSFAPAQIPFLGGTLCVDPPGLRAARANSAEITGSAAP